MSYQCNACGAMAGPGHDCYSPNSSSREAGAVSTPLHPTLVEAEQEYERLRAKWQEDVVLRPTSREFAMLMLHIRRLKDEIRNLSGPVTGEKP